jgi:arginase
MRPAKTRRPLRGAGLVQALTAAGLDVHDVGDLPEQIWKPDRERPRAQNVEQVTACLRTLAERLLSLLVENELVLVVGGNCTIALGVMAALQQLGTGLPGLLYVDRGFDLNTPASTTDGALDWMGLAHALALPGCVDLLVDAFGPAPLLEPDQIAWLGVEPKMATEWERQQVTQLGLRAITSAEFVADPPATARAALVGLPSGPLAVHFDVDVLDFTDAPLAENTDGRNTGPSLEQAVEGLLAAAGDHRFRALSIGELNPTRCVAVPDLLPRFAEAVARIIAAAS